MSCLGGLIRNSAGILTKKIVGWQCVQFFEPPPALPPQDLVPPLPPLPIWGSSPPPSTGPILVFVCDEVPVVPGDPSAGTTTVCNWVPQIPDGWSGVMVPL